MLKDVRHIPDMLLNLKSAGKVDDVGFVAHLVVEYDSPPKEAQLLLEVKRNIPCTLCMESCAWGRFMFPITTQIWSYGIKELDT